MTLHGVFDAFECFLHEFGSIESNSKKHRNIEKIRFGSIELIRNNSARFGSVRYFKKVLEFHCIEKSIFNYQKKLLKSVLSKLCLKALYKEFLVNKNHKHNLLRKIIPGYNLNLKKVDK